MTPNPARDKVKVRLPRQEMPEVVPPTAAHVLAVHRLLPPRYKLPLLVLDATGMRLGELEQLTWGDVDEPRQRWRVSEPPRRPDAPGEFPSRPSSSTPSARSCRAMTAFRSGGSFKASEATGSWTALTRACTAAGIPAFSPHDLRHRRISLLHLAGVPWARIGEHVGQRNLAVTANTYSHVLADEEELDYDGLLDR